MSINPYKIKIRPLRFATALIGERIVRSLHGKLCIDRYCRAGVIFVHIPRAGGTSIARAVIGKRAGHMTAPIPRSVWHDKPYAGGRLTGTIIHGHEISGGAVPPGNIGEAYWNFGLMGIPVVVYSRNNPSLACLIL